MAGVGRGGAATSSVHRQRHSIGGQLLASWRLRCGGRRFLLGDDLTLADIALHSTLLPLFRSGQVFVSAQIASGNSVKQLPICMVITLTHTQFELCMLLAKQQG